MKRGSFIKRLLGLAATAAVAPQLLAEEKPVTPTKKQLEEVTTYKGRGMVQVTGKQTYPKRRAVTGNVLTHVSTGDLYYVNGEENHGVRVYDLHNANNTFIVSHDQIGTEYWVVCSAIGEGSI